MTGTELNPVPATAEQRLKDVKTFFNNGEFFRAHDLALEALEAFPGDMRFAHRAVLSLANAGATKLAVEKYYQYGLDGSADIDIRSLLGRLKKDQAFAESGDTRGALLREGRAIYENTFRAAAAAHNPEAYYPAINAATLALLGGDADAGSRLAGNVLDILGPRLAALEATPPADRYWVLATALEAHLVRGDVEAARGLIDGVVKAAGQDHAALSTTGRQLERIVQAKGIDPGVLAAFEPPTIVHFVGHMIAPPGASGRFQAVQEARVATDIAGVLENMRIGAAYGSLASGADILFAEALLGRGVALNVVLPFAAVDFIEQSVRPAGESWIARFEACLAAAKTVRYATEDNYLGDDQLFTYCSGLAMGLASLCARHMHAPLMQLAVWDGVTSVGAIAGTAADMGAWRAAGHPQTVIPCGDRHPDALPPPGRPKVPPGRRDTRAMLFGDIHGFSKLSDAQLPPFTAEIMGALGRVARKYAGDIAFINTWGDGIFVVFPDAGRAAACALEMQEAVTALDLAALGLPDTLRLRLGGHLGPVYELDDPVTERLNYYGAHVSRAARIEPITPEGCVYVTETFAAVLALYNAAEFSCDYVGNTEMAKHYGRLRMFLLRRAGDGKGPAVLGDIERGA
jgi:class 3 adenylate cyclase